MKKILLGITTLLATLGLVMGVASAWTYDMSAKVACQPNGSNTITWTVNNPESQALNITSSSNVSVVPVGTHIAVNQDFTQTVSGTVNTYTLTLAGNFSGDETIRTRTASVTTTACTQPTPPPVSPPVVVTPTPAVTPPTSATPVPVDTSSNFTGQGK